MYSGNENIVMVNICMNIGSGNIVIGCNGYIGNENIVMGYICMYNGDGNIVVRYI